MVLKSRHMEYKNLYILITRNIAKVRFDYHVCFQFIDSDSENMEYSTL